MKKTGFTLVEVLLAMAILGILMLTIIPTVKKIMPNKDEAKVRKAYNTLTNVVASLTDDTEIYLDGDLGQPAGGESISDSYFCEQFKDKVNITEDGDCAAVISTKTVSSSSDLDNACENKTDKFGFKTTDKIYWYGMSSSFTDKNKYAVVCIKTVKEGNKNKNKDKKERVYSFGVRKDGRIIVGDKAQTILDKEK